MPYYVRLINLTEQGARNIKGLKRMLAEIRKTQEDMGIKLVASYATMGEYDFVSVIEAPDDEIAFKISAVLATRGNVRTKTLKAISTDDFAELTSGI